jgi:adenosylhomocysteine nucleosidase
MDLSPRIVIALSADQEWQVWLDLHPGSVISETVFGGCIRHLIGQIPVLSMRGGWGKVSAAASTQWAIDQFTPDLIINIGTCGGLEGRIERYAILLVEKTYQYDIHEQMTDSEDARRYYACELDLSWLEEQELPKGVLRATMFSADRDILPTDVSNLIKQYNARAADWESGAIAWVAKRNEKPLIILRGVSDLVSPSGGESYGRIQVFQKNTHKIIEDLAVQLPWWINTFYAARGITSPA